MFPLSIKILATNLCKVDWWDALARRREWVGRGFETFG